MAKFIEAKQPTEPSYVFELSSTELYIISGIINDMLDGRGVYMVYPEDGDNVKPNENGVKALRTALRAFDDAKADHMSFEYFDFWEVVKDAKQES